MADLKLDILVVPTYNVKSLGIVDASIYPTGQTISAPTVKINVPTFGDVTLPFKTNQFNIFTSETLGITSAGQPVMPLPDGVYYINYSITPAYKNFVEKTIIRVDKLQEKFDSAYMKTDMMECNASIKKQQKEELNSIYHFIQGAIAAANNCAIETANQLYAQASKMLDRFNSSSSGGGGCSSCNC